MLFEQDASEAAWGKDDSASIWAQRKAKLYAMLEL